jgi:hypothetical protein
MMMSLLVLLVLFDPSQVATGSLALGDSSFSDGSTDKIKVYHKWRTDVDDAVFQSLDDDFNSPGINHRDSETSVHVGVAATSSPDQASLPWCRINCGSILNNTVFVIPPRDDQKRRGAQYDQPHMLDHKGLIPHSTRLPTPLRPSATRAL